jgi:glycosyltransferase involved in cell wall biosynthesis
MEAGTMNEPWGVSIIVVNYNNERFLAAAIDSALGQNHPLCELIVVDDCSTDNSRAIIARYGDRIRSVLRDTNGGQTAALNSAWPLARHPILIFLDSDDLLFAHAAATVAGRWTAGTVKMQSPLVTIDEAGRELGHVAPKFPPNLDTATLRTALLRTGGSPVSPAAGNWYSRSLLEAVTRDGGFDLENVREYWMDWIMECNAPFYGEVVTIYEPLACYRRHDSNLYVINTIDTARFTAECRSFELRADYLTRRYRRWGIPFDPIAARNRSIWLLECRLAADKLASARDPLREPVWRTLSRALKACIDAQLPVSNRIIRAAWFVSVAVSPRTVARRLIAVRFVSTERPAWFEPVLTAIANITLADIVGGGKLAKQSVGRSWNAFFSRRRSE